MAQEASPSESLWPSTDCVTPVSREFKTALGYDYWDLQNFSKKKGFAWIVEQLKKPVSPKNVRRLKGLSPLAQDKLGKTALHYAAQNGDIIEYSRLLKVGVNPAVRDKNGKTAAEIDKQKDARHQHLISLYTSLNLPQPEDWFGPGVFEV